MINIHTITKALYDQIRKDDVIVAQKYRVEHGEYINNNPDQTPWVGVYKGPISYDPGTLGRHTQSWDASITMTVVVQASHGGSGDKCSELLGEYEAAVLDAIWADTSLGGLIDMITDFDVEYSYNNQASETLHYQQSIITITARASTG